MQLGLFTPDWIVKYLVENSLGEVLKNKKTEEIKFIDPCQGTGLILIYAFDLLYKKYMELGFDNTEAIYNILTKNLYGIDIDENACLITKLVLILKASNFVSNIFSEHFLDNMNIIVIQNSNNLSEKIYGEIVKIFKDADNFGSLIKLPDSNKFAKMYADDKLSQLQDRYNNRNNKESKDNKNDENNKINKEQENQLKNLIKQYKILSSKYDVVCTNPPYMGKKNINNKLSEFLKEKYPDTKSEMYAAFIERCLEFTEDNGYLAMITIHSWMFISSFKKLREKILNSGTLISMLHTGAATFDDLSSFNALATSFVFKKEKLDIDTCFIRLADYYSLQEKKENLNNKENYFYINQNRFFEIPNQPFIYWISENLRKCFKENKRLDEFYQAKQGLATGNNKEFVKFWYEVPYNEIAENCSSTEGFWKSRKSLCTI